MSDPTDPGAGGTPRLPPGTKVEVRTGFDRSWTNGFAVTTIEADGYRVQRRSDGEVLPTVFPASEVRRERKNAMWWV